MKNNNLLRAALSVILALALVCQMVTISFAAVEIADVEVTILHSDIGVSGMVYEATKAQHVLMYVLSEKIASWDYDWVEYGESVEFVLENYLPYLEDPNELVAALGYSATTNVNPEAFSVSVTMPDSAPTGEYVVVLRASDSPIYSKTVTYIGYEDRMGLINALNAEGLTGEDVVGILSEYKTVIENAYGVDYKAYSTLSSDAKKMFAEYVANRVNGSCTEELAEDSDFENLFDSAYVMTCIMSSDVTAKKLAEVIYEYAELLGFDSTSYEYSSLTTSGRESLATILKLSAGEYVDLSNAADDLLGAAVLVGLNETAWTNIVNYIASRNDTFFDEISADEIAKLQKKSNSKLLRLFCEKMQDEKDFMSVQDVYDAWKKCYAAAEKEYEKSNSGGGGGGGGGSSTKASDTVGKVTGTVEISNNIVPDDIKTSKTITDYYDDVVGYDWAVASILNITQLGIVEGVGNRKFDPASGLRREEFIKMLVNCFGLADLNATSSFSDVDKDAWYYVYVASAEKAGVTVGRGDGTFGVGDYVTREEMATFVYRVALKFNVEFDPATLAVYVFSDVDTVDDYAKEAVRVLGGCDVLRGVGDDGSKFEPRTIADRATAAYAIDKVYAIKNSRK